MAKLKVIQDEENQIPVEVMADAVVRLAEGVKRLNQTPLNKKAVAVLVSAHTGIARSTVTRVLDSLDELESVYLKKKLK